MDKNLKLALWWLCAFCGAVLIIISPINLKGLGMGAAGVGLLVAGLIPAMKARRQVRLAREQAQ